VIAAIALRNGLPIVTGNAAQFEQVRRGSVLGSERTPRESSRASSKTPAREVDGPIHARRPSADMRREHELQRAGFRIVSISAQLVLTDLSAAVALVGAAL